MRKFDTGAIRDTDVGKYDYEGYFDPKVLEAFASYMHHHQQMPDGSTRSSDNWQKGFPLDAYMKSMLRHVMDLWLLHRGHEVVRPEDNHVVTIADALGGIVFNAQGYWSVSIKDPHLQQTDPAL